MGREKSYARLEMQNYTQYKPAFIILRVASDEAHHHEVSKIVWRPNAVHFFLSLVCYGCIELLRKNHGQTFLPNLRYCLLTP